VGQRESRGREEPGKVAGSRKESIKGHQLAFINQNLSTGSLWGAKRGERSHEKMILSLETLDFKPEGEVQNVKFTATAFHTRREEPTIYWEGKSHLRLSQRCHLCLKREL